MTVKQPISGAANVNTIGFQVNDTVIFIVTKATPRSLFVGIETGVILQFRDGRARVGNGKGRSVWVDVHRLRPVSAAAALEKAFLRNME